MPNITTKYASILVSGASGDIGIGIGRILKSYGFKHIYGCDINEDSWGVCVFDSVNKICRANDKAYLQQLKSLITELSIELFIPSSEAEIKLLNSVSDLEQFLGCKVLMANSNVIDIGLDKLSTSLFLKEENQNYPWTVDASESKPLDFPCIYKPVSGQGSKGLEIVKTEQRALELMETEGYVFQELLTPDDQEYTCGVFRSQAGEIRVINIQRTLSGGFTNKGTVVENSDIDEYIKYISESLNVVGAVNMQLRLTERGPVLFEINPRLSSTLVFRHKMGFCDLIWAIEDLSGVQLSPYSKPKDGTQFYRGLAEYFKN